VTIEGQPRKVSSTSSQAGTASTLSLLLISGMRHERKFDRFWNMNASSPHPERAVSTALQSSAGASRSFDVASGHCEAHTRRMTSRHTSASLAGGPEQA